MKSTLYFIILTALLCIDAQGVTIFETFDTDPLTRGWTKSEISQSTEWIYYPNYPGDFVGGGHLLAKYTRDEYSDRYSIDLGETFDHTTEFWLEFDMATHRHQRWERGLFGVFNSSSTNSENFIGVRIFRQETDAGSSAKAVDRLYSYSDTGAITGPMWSGQYSIDPGEPVRVRIHYWYDAESETGLATVETWALNEAGPDDDALLTNASGVVVPSGTALSFDTFGFGTMDGSYSSMWQRILADNLYFSTVGPNSDYVDPAFVAISQDVTPPQPNPMTWEVEPTAIRPTRITMTASEAVDDEHDVEYLFENVTDPERTSGWQTARTWTDTGLNDDTTYDYRVKARDTSSNRNETDWSPIASATTPAEWDTNPPTPNPMTWKNEPTVISFNTITMTATTAVDAEGNTPVQYYFANLTDPSRDSGWQNDPAYVDTGLLYDTEYSYRVKARDASANYNETDWSDVVTVQTESEPPLTAYLRESMAWTAGHVDADIPVDVYFKNSVTSEPAPVIVYIMNHGHPRIGQEPDASILLDYIDEAYIVITMDFAGIQEAVSPTVDYDLHAMYRAIYGSGTIPLLIGTGLDPQPNFCWFLPAGSRLARDVAYFELDRHGSHGTKERVLNTWNNNLDRFGVPMLSDPDEMYNPDGSPLDWTLRMDIVYPSQPSQPSPLIVWNGTVSTRRIGAPTTFRPHFWGFSLRGYVFAVTDHCYNPLARHWAYGHFEPGYSLDDWNGLKSNTAAIRYLRKYADMYGIDTDHIGVWGHSKGAYGATRLADPEHESQGEHFTFSGFPEGTPEPQPWQGYSSQITASYQSMGNGTRRIQYVSSRNVPTVIAVGRFDQFSHWDVFPPLVGAYEAHDANHLAFWMETLGHELPYEHDPVLDVDRYATSLAFFEQYLKPDRHPEVLYILPKNGRDDVDARGHSPAISDASILPDDTFDYVSYTQPITVHFGQRMDADSVINGDIQVVQLPDKTPVDGQWTALRDNTVFRFTPASILQSQTEYQITVTTDAVNTDGLELLEERHVIFQTDWFVHLDELMGLAQRWLQSVEPDDPFDYDNSGFIDLADFHILTTQWGRSEMQN